MLHIILIYRQMVLYILTGYRVLGIVYLDQLKGASHTHILVGITCLSLLIWGYIPKTNTGTDREPTIY